MCTLFPYSASPLNGGQQELGLIRGAIVRVTFFSRSYSAAAAVREGRIGPLTKASSGESLTRPRGDEIGRDLRTFSDMGVSESRVVRSGNGSFGYGVLTV
jgi:hypothetical protein